MSKLSLPLDESSHIFKFIIFGAELLPGVVNTSSLIMTPLTKFGTTNAFHINVLKNILIVTVKNC